MVGELADMDSLESAMRNGAEKVLYSFLLLEGYTPLDAALRVIDIRDASESMRPEQRREYIIFVIDEIAIKYGPIRIYGGDA